MEKIVAAAVLTWSRREARVWRRSTCRRRRGGCRHRRSSSCSSSWGGSSPSARSQSPERPTPGRTPGTDPSPHSRGSSATDAP